MRAHEAEARTHYSELVRAGRNAAAVRRHAAAVHQHLAAALAATGAGTTHQDDWSANAKPMEKPIARPPAAGQQHN